MKQFKAKHHEEDKYEVEQNSVRIHQVMHSGAVVEVFLTNEALEELYKASKETVK